MKKVVFCILWLTCHNICLCVEESDKTVASDTKVKRYLHHGIHDSSSPCPPFSPHFHTPVLPMYSPKLYSQPIYTKTEPMVHGPSAPYVPKQMVAYMKPQIPMPHYHYLPSKPMIHQDQPIQHLIKQQAQWQYQPAQVLNYEKPHFAYAPTYHKPMIQQVSYMKGWESPINYHTVQANNFIRKPPGIVYKSESHYCEPCHQAAVKPLQHKSLPQFIHVPPSYVKPVIHQAPIKPASYYLPSKSHVQLPIIKHPNHDYPCSK